MKNLRKMHFIGGASKSGTTALYYYLKQHPDIFLPEKKELHYFSRPELLERVGGPGDRFVVNEVPSSLDDYLAFYSGCQNSKTCIDISPSYLTFPGSAERIKKIFPDAKMVFVLRNPADKAFSQYVHLRSVCRENLDFEQALDAEAERKKYKYSDMWLYRESGFYADRLQSFISCFGSDSMRVYLFEEFVKDQHSIVHDICDFFEVRSDYNFSDPGQVNHSALPKSQMIAEIFLKPNPLSHLARRVLPKGLGRALRATIRKLNAGDRVKFPSGLREKMLSDYYADIQRVESILGRKTGWV